MKNGMLKHGTRNAEQGKRQTADNYVKRYVTSKLPPPPELVDKNLQIKLLQEDLKREEEYIGRLRMNIGALRSANADLRDRILELRKELRTRKIRRQLNRDGIPEIRDIRLRFGYSIKEMADKTGCSRSAYQLRETGKRSWPQEIVDKVCELLHIEEGDAFWPGGIQDD